MTNFDMWRDEIKGFGRVIPDDFVDQDGKNLVMWCSDCPAYHFCEVKYSLAKSVIPCVNNWFEWCRQECNESMSASCV